MADPTPNAPAAAPAAAPTPAPAAPAPQAAPAPNPTVKRDPQRSSPLVTNPPVPAAPAKEATPDLPPSTVAEMEAGRKALASNKPYTDAVAQAQKAQAEKDK